MRDMKRAVRKNGILNLLGLFLISRGDTARSYKRAGGNPTPRTSCAATCVRVVRCVVAASPSISVLRLNLQVVNLQLVCIRSFEYF